MVVEFDALAPRPDTLKPISHVSPQTGGKGCSALLLAGSDLVGSMQGKLLKRLQIPVKHGAIGQSLPALCQKFPAGVSDAQRLPVVLFEFRAHPSAHQRNAPGQGCFHVRTPRMAWVNSLSVILFMRSSVMLGYGAKPESRLACGHSATRSIVRLICSYSVDVIALLN